MKAPETKYARSGDVSIAYEIVGAGLLDIVLVPGWVSNLEVFWEEPSVARFFERLASFSRLILFDKRGTGLSDRMSDIPNLETRMDDVRAVMDRVGSERAALVGISEGASMCVLFAATYPERTSALVIVGGFARRVRAPDHPWGPTQEDRDRLIEERIQQWGGAVAVETFAPSVAADVRFRDWWARFLRLSASPGASATILRMNNEIDVRGILPAIRVPALIIHNEGDRVVAAGCGRYMGEQIPGARYVELPGEDHLPWVGNAEVILDEIEVFLTGFRHAAEPDRVLATVMFTDIVDATRRAVELGDRRWRDLLESHHRLVRNELGRFRGREIDTAGDGFLAAFDGPARAVRAAAAIVGALRRIGLEVRVGLHTGECEVIGSKLGGIAVHIGARVAALATAGEILVSSTVKDLVAGSGIHFTDRGVHPLKGVPGDWRLFAATSTGS